MLKKNYLQQVEQDDLLSIVLIVDRNPKSFEQATDYKVNHLSAQLSIVADWANQKFHEFTGWGIHNLSFLVKFFAKHLHILTHNELESQLHDTCDVPILKID